MYPFNPPGPALPEDERRPRKRQRELATKQSRYGYSLPADNPVAPIAIAGRLPLSEGYGPRWVVPHLPQFLRSVRGALLAQLRTRARRGPAENKAGAFADLYGLAGLPFPSVLEAPLLEDRWLARGWLDGPNPLVLTRVENPRSLTCLSNEDERRAIHAALPGGLSLEAACADNRLFEVSYALLSRALLHGDRVGRDTRFREKYLPAPTVLLFRDVEDSSVCELRPLAIRIDQPESHGHNPLYFPNDGKAWDLAKLYVSVADFNQQTLSSHIQRHHFVLEAFALATRRQLASRHPLHVLLAPHIAYTFAVNRAATRLLAQRGSVFERMYAGRLPETRKVLTESHAALAFSDLEVRRDIRARGVATYPSEFPFRDDALLWTEVIDRFVRGYVEHFYGSDGAVTRDSELARWLEELSDPRCGNLRGLDAEGAPGASREALVRLVSQVLFAAGPGHASVHYPQTDFMTFAATHPGAAYRPPPGLGEIVDDARLEETLPPYSSAVLQFFTNQIAYYRFDRFGDYDRYGLGRVSEVAKHCQRLRADLADIEEQIGDRNHRRVRPYRYLLPSLVPNSVNI